MLLNQIRIKISTSSVDSVLIVVPVPPAGLLRLLALRTIVATVRQYKALAKAFLVELHYWRESKIKVIRNYYMMQLMFD